MTEQENGRRNGRFRKNAGCKAHPWGYFTTLYKFMFIVSRQGLIDLYSTEQKKIINSQAHVTTALHNYVFLIGIHQLLVINSWPSGFFLQKHCLRKSRSSASTRVGLRSL